LVVSQLKTAKAAQRHARGTAMDGYRMGACAKPAISFFVTGSWQCKEASSEHTVLSVKEKEEKEDK
jgi:hypothetical protein